MIDEKSDNFLLLAEHNEGQNRLYAFIWEGKILVVEDIPENYPRFGVYSIKGLKGLVKDLERRGWNIVKNNVT